MVKHTLADRKVKAQYADTVESSKTPPPKYILYLI